MCQNEHSTNDNSQSFLKSCLKNWSKSEVCPLEDPDIHWSATELRENDSQSHFCPSSNQFSSSNEETDDESSNYKTASCSSAQALSSIINSLRSHYIHIIDKHNHSSNMKFYLPNFPGIFFIRLALRLFRN